MSNLDLAPDETVCAGPVGGSAGPAHELLVGREVMLGPRGMEVTRTLPHRDRRMIGAWCFVDAYGPENVVGGQGMQVPPHPHTGLQTVSWLVGGDVLHRDSLGNRQLIRPGQLNLMTAGRAISHSEESPPDRSPILHGVQLWVALPDRDREAEPHFEHHANLPVLTGDGVSTTVIMGELDGARSGAEVYSPLVGLEVTLAADVEATLALQPQFEHGALVLSGGVDVDGVVLERGPLLYLGSSRAELTLRTGHPSRLLVIGGEPFDEQIVMWWNFVGRDHDEIVRFREEWESGTRFGTVVGYGGNRLPAPPLPNSRLRPRGRLP